LSVARRLVIPGLVLGAIIRAAALPLPGMEDFGSWKVWSFAAAHDPTSVYGVGGSPPERRILRWHDAALTTDYPPLALDELGAVGRLYRAVSPTYEDSTLLSIGLKLPGLLAEIGLLVVLLTWGRRVYGWDLAAAAALTFWLNPAILIDGAALGFLDAQMAVPAVMSLMAIFAGWPSLAGVLLSAAILTKPHPVFVAPVVMAALLTRPAASRAQAAVRFLAGSGVATAAIVGPVIVRGAWSNLVQAVGRLATHDMVSAQAANIWWLLTYVLRVLDVWREWGPREALAQRLRILGISRVIALGYPNPRAVGLILVGLAIVWATWRMRRARSLAEGAALAGWTAWAYAMLAAQVHENHLYLAVPFLAVAAGLDRRYSRLCWTVSLIATLNLYLFEGLGMGWPPLVDRTSTFIDASVLLAVVNVGAFVWFTLNKGTGVFARPPTEMPSV
jgi:hypothetical protein